MEQSQPAINYDTEPLEALFLDEESLQVTKNTEPLEALFLDEESLQEYEQKRKRIIKEREQQQDMEELGHLSEKRKRKMAEYEREREQIERLQYERKREQIERLQYEREREQIERLQWEQQQVWTYRSRTRKVNIQNSDGRGQVRKVSYEDKEVRSHVTGAVCTSETVSEGEVDKVKVTAQKSSHGHKKQEPVTKSAETSSYATASKKDICTEGFSSTPATSEQPPTLAFSPQPPPLAPPAAAAPSSTSPTPPEAKDEVTQLAQKLLKAVNSKKKSDQDSLNVLSEQLGGSVIMIQNTVNNNHYHTHYHNHNNTCEEVRVETSETVNVCVGGPLKVYQQRQPQNDDNGDEDGDENSHGTDSDKENGDDEDNDDDTMYLDLDDENMEK